MAQNIYDSPSFFAQYAAMPRSQHGLSESPEWPVLQLMIGSVARNSVLDLGCGYGWYCRWAAEQGASSVKGVDISAMMIQRARELTAKGSGGKAEDGDEGGENGSDSKRDEFGRISYEVADLESIVLEENAYDLIFSSLTLHYVTTPALTRLLAQISRALRPRGRFVFSVEHPIATAPSSPFWTAHPDSGKEIWPLDAYAKEGERVVEWLGSSVVKQHRMVETYVAGLLGSGLRLEGYRDWRPSGADLERWGWVRCLERPIYLLMAGAKEGVPVGKEEGEGGRLGRE
jgi:SAM-dependent methyltransferase